MQIQKVIEELGYSANEAKVYLAALSLGECHVSDIAAKVKLPRSSVQAIVDKLHKDGLMNFYVQRRYKYWVAENPERLLANLKKREADIASALPSLTAMRKSSWGKRKAGANAEAVEGLFRTLADASSQPVLVADENVEIVYVNAAWETQFGYTLDEVRGENPRILQSGKTPRAVYERMWQYLAADRMFQTDEVVDKRKDGTFFNLLTTVLPVRHGGRLFYIQILDDTTGERRAGEIQKRFMRSEHA